jgi:hypothetical protein
MMVIAEAILFMAAAATSSLVETPIQEASAEDGDFTFKQNQENKCRGSAICTNDATITFGG